MFQQRVPAQLSVIRFETYGTHHKARFLTLLELIRNSPRPAHEKTAFPSRKRGFLGSNGEGGTVSAGHGPRAANGISVRNCLSISILRRSIPSHPMRFEPLQIDVSRPVLGPLPLRNSRCSFRGKQDANYFDESPIMARPGLSSGSAWRQIINDVIGASD